MKRSSSSFLVILLTLNLNNNQIKFGSIKDPKFVPVVSRRRKTIKSPLLINARDANKERHLEEVCEEVEPRGSFLNQDDSSDEGISRAKSNDKSPLKSCIANIVKSKRSISINQSPIQLRNPSTLNNSSK